MSTAPKLRNDLQLRTAHDVRRLRPCYLCDGLGDNRRMLALPGGLAHSSCVVETMLPAQILNLPAAERNKLTLGDTGVELMRALLDKSSDER